MKRGLNKGGAFKIWDGVVLKNINARCLSVKFELLTNDKKKTNIKRQFPPPDRQVAALAGKNSLSQKHDVTVRNPASEKSAKHWKYKHTHRKSTARTCESVVHFRGLVVIVVVSRHYSDALHVIVGLGALRRRLLGICIVEDYCSNDGLLRRLGGPIIVA